MVFCLNLVKCHFLNRRINRRNKVMARCSLDYADSTWLSKDFLQKILIEAESDSTVKILESKVEDSTHQGCFSSVKHVTLRFQKSADGKKVENDFNFVAKTLPNEDGKDAMISNSNVFSTEIKMYRETLPAMFKLLNNGAQQERFVNFGPKCLYTESKPQCVLLLQDLSSKGYKTGNTASGLDLEHSIAVIKTLARFHASSIALHCKSPESVECYSENLMLTETSTAYMTSFITCQIDLLSNAIKGFSIKGSEIAEKLQSVKSTLLSNVRRCIEDNSSSFRVLTHGDLWTNNVMFKYDETGQIIKDTKFIDFQLCYYSSASLDLQYFFSTSLTRDVYYNYKTRLLEIYQKELCEILTLLGVPDKIVTFEEILEDLESKDFFGFFWTLMALPLILPDKQSETSPMIDNNKQNQNKYCEIILERLALYENKGYF